MTDTLKDLIPRTRELGRLRSGHQDPVLDAQGNHVRYDKGPLKGQLKYKPVKRTTWRLTSPSQELLNVAAELYGGTVEVWADAPPQGRQYQLATEREAIEVLIPLTDAALSLAYEMWGGGGCQRRCNGERMSVVNGTSLDPEGEAQPCMCPAVIEARMEEAQAGKACKPTTRLNVLLPDIPDLGFWRLEAHGYSAAVEIPGTLALYRGLAQTYGDGLTIVKANLRIDQRTSKKGGQTRHFTVPVIETPSLTPRVLLTGEAPALRSNGPGQVERGSAPALEAGEARTGDPATSAVPPPTDDSVLVTGVARQPFDESDEVLFGMEGANWLLGLCHDAGLSEDDIFEVVMAASGGRTSVPRMLFKSEKEAAKRAFATAVAAQPAPSEVVG